MQAELEPCASTLNPHIQQRILHTTHFHSSHTSTPILSWKLGKGFQFFIALRKNALAGKVGKNTFLGFSGYFSPWWSLARLSSQILTAGIKEISTKVYSVVY